MIAEKTCTRCGELKPLEDFHRLTKSRDGRQPQCRICRNAERREYWRENKAVLSEKHREYRQANAQRLSRYNREWRAKNARKIRDNKLLNAYGIAQEHYDAMLEAQGGVCAICGSETPRSAAANHFHVDHCHETGRVRGLLCSSCNTGLGRFRDDTDLLRRAVEYLNERP